MNHWRMDSWAQGGWNVSRYTCTLCGFRFEHFAIDGTFWSVTDKKSQHEQQCWQPDPKCSFVFNPDAVPVLRCKLVSGHPEGPQFDWFTDYNGHVLEKP